MSVITAKVAVRREDAARKTREKGLNWGDDQFNFEGGGKGRTESTYFLRKWGRRVREGRRMNAGKVMRLNMPTTKRNPRIEDANTPDRFYVKVS